MTKVTAEKRKKHILKARIVGVLFILFLIFIYNVDKSVWTSDADISTPLTQRGLMYLFPALSSPFWNFIMSIVPVALFIIFLDKITDYFAKISK